MVVVGGEDTCTHELIRTRSLLPDVCSYSASWNASIRGMSRAFFSFKLMGFSDRRSELQKRASIGLNLV